MQESSLKGIREYPAEGRAAKAIRETFESGRPIAYIRADDEQRVASILREVAQAPAVPAPMPVWTLSLTEGMRREGEEPPPIVEDPRAALDFIIAYNHGPAIFHLKDFHEALRESAEIRRRLRDVYQRSLQRRKFVVITSPVRSLPEEVERSVVYLDLRPPDVVELEEFLGGEVARISPGIEIGANLLRQLAGTLRGLSLDEVRYALRRACAVSPRLGPETLPALMEEKRLLINRSGVIEFISGNTRMEDIGGLENMKKWLLAGRRVDPKILQALAVRRPCGTDEAHSQLLQHSLGRRVAGHGHGHHAVQWLHFECAPQEPCGGLEIGRASRRER